MQQSTRFAIDDSMRFLLAYLNLNEVQVLQSAGLPIDFFERKTRSLSSEEYFRLWESLVKNVDQDRPFPLLLESLPITAGVSPPILAALCSRDFNTFVKRIRDFKPLIGPLVLVLEETEEEFSIGITIVNRDVPLHKDIVASEFVFFTKIIREATGTHVNPVLIESMERLDKEAYGSFFGVEPKIGNKDRIVFRVEDTHIPFSMRSESVWEYFEPELRKRLDELKKDSSFAARVRAVLFEILPMGLSSMGDVSGKLNMSDRTLQRRLQAEQTSYQQQLNHSRELLARHHLTSSEMTVSGISFLLGYEEPSSFSRAFHAWTGLSPESYRASTD